MIKGVDISKWQSPVDFAKMKAGGIEFAIFRGYFDDQPDKTFPVYHADAGKAGMIRGVYHFVNYAAEPETQGKLLADRYNANPCELGLWCDFEYYQPFGNLPSRDKCVNWLYRYMNTVEAKTGHVCGLYCNSNMVSSVLKPAPRWLLEKPLWIAHWGSFASPVIGEWPAWLLWQWTAKGDGKTLGASSLDLDLDRYNGTLSELRAWCGLEPLPDIADLWLAVGALTVDVEGLKAKLARVKESL